MNVTFIAGYLFEFIHSLTQEIGKHLCLIAYNFEWKHLVYKGDTFLKEEVSRNIFFLILSSVPPLGKNSFLLSLGIPFVAKDWGLFINCQSLLVKTFPTLPEWHFYSKQLKSNSSYRKADNNSEISFSAKALFLFTLYKLMSALPMLDAHYLRAIRNTNV